MSALPSPESEWWQENGYLAGAPIPGSDGLWLCLARMFYTYRVMICTPNFVHEFWCYPHELGVAKALGAWAELLSGGCKGDPIDGWVKHHPSGRRNPPDPLAS